MASVNKATTPPAKPAGSASAKGARPAGGQQAQAKPQINPNAVANLTGSILRAEALNQVAAHLRAGGSGVPPAQGPVLGPAQGPAQAPQPPLLAPGQVPGPQVADPRQLAMLQLLAANGRR